MDQREIKPSQSPTLTANRTAVLLIAHGSRQQAANDDLRELAGRLSAEGTYTIVEPCFLELAEPDIPTGAERCVSRGATRVLIVPDFLSAGVHLRRDLTAARDEMSRRHSGVEFLLGSPLGPHPLLDHLVAIRVRELEEAIDSALDQDRVPEAERSAPEPPFAIGSLFLKSLSTE
jgi:sirohydrochlorin ferrochelatase